MRKNINKNLSFAEIPVDTLLHDLASLSTIDSKVLDPEQLGIDTIKEQQAANLKHSSNKCAIIPDDQTHIMLAGVSFILCLQMCISFSYPRYLHVQMLELNQHISFTGDADAPDP